MELSEAAIAVLRCEIKGYGIKVSDSALGAYRKLVDAGIMETAPEGGFRFTEDGRSRRREILDDAEAHRVNLQPRLPDRIDLSEVAREVLRLVLTEDHVAVTPEDKEAYHELARAGIMFPVSGFTGGPEAMFRFTDQGWSRRHEWLALPAGPP